MVFSNCQVIENDFVFCSSVFVSLCDTNRIITDFWKHSYRSKTLINDFHIILSTSPSRLISKTNLKLTFIIEVILSWHTIDRPEFPEGILPQGSIKFPIYLSIWSPDRRSTPVQLLGRCSHAQILILCGWEWALDVSSSQTQRCFVTGVTLLPLAASAALPVTMFGIWSVIGEVLRCRERVWFNCLLCLVPSGSDTHRLDCVTVTQCSQPFNNYWRNLNDDVGLSR